MSTEVEAVDSRGNTHTLGLRVSTFTSLYTVNQYIGFHVHSVDARTVQGGYFSTSSIFDPSGQSRLEYFEVMRADKTDLVDLKCLNRAEQSEQLIDLGDDFDETSEEEYIVSEIAALRLLEQQASELEHEISIRRQAVSMRMVDHRSRKPLKELIDQCDGIVCAAGQIATRLCDNINLATTSRNGYAQLQQPLRNSEDAMSTGHNQTATDRQYSRLEEPNNYFMKALAYVASILGLTAIFAIVKRKCMSMRTRVERAADREERRNARAYRKAARRAEMRRRFDKLVSFFKAKQQPRMTDYDEKRALILQDALLEQDLNQLEKGDIMEAEIRQLRHAHEIVSGIVQLRQTKAGAMAVHDPPPPLVALPSTPARSRASTGTLPSYNSEEPPDYSSIPEPINENTTTDGFAYYRPSSDGYALQYVPQAPASSSSSRPTRSTPISSVAALSPRISFETLRTRASRADSRVSRPH